MANKANMDRYAQALAKRHKAQIQNKDRKGVTTRSNIYRYENIPEGVSIWMPQAGNHFIDIIPFPVGPDMPLDRETGVVVTPEGEIDYLIDVDMHVRIGENNADFVCPKNNFGERCPICAYIAANRLEKEEWQKIRPTRRTFYLVWVHDTPEEERKGLQIWQVAHFFMENKLQPLATLPRGGGFKMYSHPVDGSNISFNIKKNGPGQIEYLGHALYDRERPIPQSILDLTFPLDQVIKMHPTYDEINKEFKGYLAARDTGTGPETEDDVPLGESIDWYADEDKPQEPAKPKKGMQFKFKKG